MADGKWIEDVRSDSPLAEAARRVLAVRLQVVGEALPPALRESGRDPEHVHRLRVATRRADAALRIFQASLPEKVFKAARRRLRRIRRAAGAARDWDVFLLELVARRAERPAAEHAGIDFLTGFAFGQRAAAQPELENAGGKNGAEFGSFTEETSAAVTPAVNGTTLVQLARPLLSSLVHRLEEATREDLGDYARLHQVRIAGKRLRYAMEVFAGCFPAEFRETIYPRVEEMQEILGRANDSHVAADRLAALRERMRESTPAEWKRARAGFDAVIRFHTTRLPRERKQFLAWWRRWGKGGSEELMAMLHAADAASQAKG
jgi:CHAD domain-containing protein